MTLKEMAVEYRLQEQQLQARILVLRRRQKLATGQQRLRLEQRINQLTTLRREAREIAALLEHYYERGYCKRGKYAL